MLKIAVISGKGGVGKSSTAVALAAAMIEAGHKALLLDLDPNGSASYASGLDLDGILPPGSTALDALEGRRLFPLASPEGYALLAGTPALETRVQRRTSRITGISTDVLVIDAPPGFSPLPQTAVELADVVVVPITAEPLAVRTIEHVLGLLDGLKAREKIAGVVVTMFEPRRILSNDQVSAIEKLGVPIVGYIPRAVAVAEAASAGRSVMSYAPRSAAAGAYRALAATLYAKGIRAF